MPTDRYDVVIVGGGSAGCVLAARLSERPGRSVLLLEAGPDYGSTVDGQPADVADASRMVDGHDWGHTGDVGRPDGPVPLYAGRIVGGGSAVNMAMALRGQPSDYDDWAAAGNPGWTFHQILPYFRRVERDLDFGDRWWHGGAGPVPVRRFDDDEFVPVQRAFLDAATALGHPFVVDHNAPGMVGAGRQPVNAVAGVRQSTALTYLRAARRRPNLTIRPDCPVDRVVIEDGRAAGVRPAGSTETIAGRRVIVAAGSFGSPAVLLRSGVGPAGDLAPLGVPVRRDLPGVGANLHDHPLLRIRHDTADAAVPLQHQAMLTLTGDDGRVDRQVFPSGPVAEPTGAVLTLLVALLRPRSRGRVRLTAADPAAPLSVVPGHLDHPDDLPRIVDGVRQARRIAAAPPLAGHLGAETWPGPAVRDDESLGNAVRAGMNTYHHPVGTCRMGPADDAGAVVDATGRVHGVDGLRVVDASIMPAIPAANTNLPTLMLAERCAERIDAEADGGPPDQPPTA